ncbi:hypothetical protein [Anoxybacter fermentans]|nr:hypothetical protein [Anoxybacter fermentans]
MKKIIGLFLILFLTFSISFTVLANDLQLMSDYSIVTTNGPLPIADED